jgi:hydrogenase maturation factor
VDADRVPVLPEAQALCRAFGLDPLGTIASGALLLAVDPADAARVIDACASVRIACVAIGSVTARDAGVTLADGSGVRPMPEFPQDEITKLFAEG